MGFVEHRYNVHIRTYRAKGKLFHINKERNIKFYNFLVKGSFDPDFNLRRVDVLPCSWGMLVTLKVTKTLVAREIENI
jgi:hypothetical protein